MRMIGMIWMVYLAVQKVIIKKSSAKEAELAKKRVVYALSHRKGRGRLSLSVPRQV